MGKINIQELLSGLSAPDRQALILSIIKDTKPSRVPRPPRAIVQLPVVEAIKSHVNDIEGLKVELRAIIKARKRITYSQFSRSLFGRNYMPSDANVITKEFADLCGAITRNNGGLVSDKAIKSAIVLYDTDELEDSEPVVKAA